MLLLHFCSRGRSEVSLDALSRGSSLVGVCVEQHNWRQLTVMLMGDHYFKLTGPQDRARQAIGHGNVCFVVLEL
jgi:hypothetical protein